MTSATTTNFIWDGQDVLRGLRDRAGCRLFTEHQIVQLPGDLADARSAG